jgi:hypothetical protein
MFRALMRPKSAASAMHTIELPEKLAERIETCEVNASEG